MDTINIILIVSTSAAFATLIGRILDAFLLNRINDKYERIRWLRQTKFESFAKISEEILSLGFHSLVQDNLWKFRALSVQAILLIEDRQLKKDIDEIIEEINKIANGTSTLVKSNLPDDFYMELPDGTKLTKKNFEDGYAINIIEKKAFVILESLGKDLRNT